MKLKMKYLYIALLFIVTTGCSKDITENENCIFLLNIPVNFNINLNLPQFSQLKFGGNSIYVPNEGNGGVIITFTGVNYFAWDARDPNVTQQSCSILEPSGLNASTTCTAKNEYSLVTGRSTNNPDLPCSLRNYRVEAQGNSLRIFF